MNQNGRFGASKLVKAMLQYVSIDVYQSPFTVNDVNSTPIQPTAYIHGKAKVNPDKRLHLMNHLTET